MSGESSGDLANCRFDQLHGGRDIRDALRRNLGVRKDAEAVRIGLIAEVVER